MMRGRIIRHASYEGVLYTSYDEWAYCTPEGAYYTPVMMRAVLYTSNDERTYCTPVMMRGPMYASYDEGPMYASYDEGAYVCQL